MIIMFAANGASTSETSPRFGVVLMTMIGTGPTG
jgi:hypothetical protein